MEEILNRVEMLADLDLRKELSSRSFSCGPIVGTTRSVYKKKLVDMLLDEELPAEARTSRADASSEEEEEEFHSQPKYVNGGSRVSAAKVNGAVAHDEDEDKEEDEEEEEEVVEEVADSKFQEESSEEEEEVANEDEGESQDSEEDEEPKDTIMHSGGDVLRHRVPGPSDSFETKTHVSIVSEDGKTLKRTTTTTTRVVKASDLRSDAVPVHAPPASSTVAQPEKPKKKSSFLSILFQLIVIAIIVFFVYVIVMGPSTPLGLPSKPDDVENPPVGDDAV